MALVELMDHQKEALKKLKSGKILYGGLGTGKSITALAYYTEVDNLGDLYIITTAKKRDSLEWEADAAKYGISTDGKISMYGSITVDSWHNIAKYEHIKDCTFIFDEQRLLNATGVWVRSFQKIAKNNAWILCTATPGDTWIDYAPIFIANGFYKNITEFRHEHVIYSRYSRFPKIEGYANQKKLEALRDQVLVTMPFMKHTVRDEQRILVSYNKELITDTIKNRWNPYTDAPIKDAAELFATLRKIVYTDPSRLGAIRKIMEDHPRLIIFYNYNYELALLRELNDTWSDLYTVAEWNGSKKEPIPYTDNWVYLVQYTAGAEGWNCTSTDAMAFYSLNYSYRKFEQAHGRIDRMNTLYKFLSYFVLTSDSVVDKAVEQALDKKKTFNEKRWANEHFGPKFEI